MRVELDLPDWVEGRSIHILAGIEEAARKLPGKPWQVKTGRCSRCGKCCDDCPYLKYDANEYRCSLGVKMPYECCISDGVLEKNCAIKWQDLD